MHALATALMRMHALMTAFRMHTCAHYGAHPLQVRELLISQGVLECTSRTTRVLTARTTREELFSEVR